MHVSAASLAPDWSVRKATPSDNTERTARSGAVVETIYLSRPRRAQCIDGFATGTTDLGRIPFKPPPIVCVKYGSTLLEWWRTTNGVPQSTKTGRVFFVSIFCYCCCFALFYFVFDLFGVFRQ